MVRYRLLMPSIVCLALLGLLGNGLTTLGIGTAVAQTETAQNEIDAPLTAEERERLYEELGRDVDAFEKQLSIFNKVVELVRPTVVHIDASRAVERVLNFGEYQRVEEAGSGVVIDLSGQFYVLTNRHVVKNSEPDDITIRLGDGREIHPTKKWSDEGTDIAVLAISAPQLVAARFGDSDRLEIGDLVLAVGSPFGLNHSVTHGMISAKGRRDLELGSEDVKFQDFLQTDAAINPGNSGGPLINLRGEVIGINTAIASASGGNEGIGFSIPINMVTIIARQLTERGSVIRGFFGVTLDGGFNPTVAAELGLPRLQGARIKEITANSPAELAKLKVGDVILRFGKVSVEDSDHLVNIVSLTTVDTSVPVVIFRDGKVQELAVKVANRRDFPAAP